MKKTFHISLFVVLIGIFVWNVAQSALLRVEVVPQGGTGTSTFSINGIIVSGTSSTSPLTASSSPTVGWVYSTSTTITSIFNTGVNIRGTASTSLLTVSNLGNTATRCLNLTNQGVVGVAAGDCASALSGGSINTLAYWTSATAISATSSPTVGYLVATTLSLIHI